MIKVKDGEITLDYLGGPDLTTWVFKIENLSSYGQREL